MLEVVNPVVAELFPQAARGCEYIYRPLELFPEFKHQQSLARSKCSSSDPYSAPPSSLSLLNLLLFPTDAGCGS